eukprot:4524601-Amphidinium_carterae.1
MLRLLLMLPLVVFGMKLVPMPSLKLASCVFAVEKRWRTLSTLCITVLLGRQKGTRLSFRPTPKKFFLVSSCMHGLLPAPQKQCIIILEPALVCRPGVHTVWTDTVVIRIFAGVELVTTLTLAKVSGCPCQGLSNQSSELSYWPVLEECKPKRFVSDCKGVVSCPHALRAGRRHPKCKSFPVGQRCGRRACGARRSAR